MGKSLEWRIAGQPGVELNIFYDEFAKPWSQRRLPMRHEPRDEAVDVHRLRQEENGASPTPRPPTEP